MKTLIALNLKYLMEGREDDLQEDMEKFIDNLIFVAKLDDEILSLKERYSQKYEELFGQKEIAREQLEIDMVSLL